MPVTKAQLQAAAADARTLLKIVQDSIDGLTADPSQAVLDALRKMLSNPDRGLSKLMNLVGAPVLPPAAPAAAPPAPPLEGIQLLGLDKTSDASASDRDGKAAVMSFSEFLTQIGDAMLDAQQELDTKSADYLAKIGPNSPVLPSIFRLPKLSGAMKFAFQKSGTNKMNLVFFSAGTQESTQHQQEIRFDMVSVPAPAEALGELRNKAPRVELLLSPATRDDVIKAARAAKPKRPTSKLPDDFEPDRVLIVDSESPGVYFLLYADKAADGNVGLWRITLGTPPVIDAVYRFDKQFSEAEVTFRDLVNVIATRQRDFLKSVRA